jgi:hypothetical protein
MKKLNNEIEFKKSNIDSPFKFQICGKLKCNIPTIFKASRDIKIKLENPIINSADMT